MAERYMRIVEVRKGGKFHIAAEGTPSLSLCGMYGDIGGRARLDQDCICKRCLRIAGDSKGGEKR